MSALSSTTGLNKKGLGERVRRLGDVKNPVSVVLYISCVENTLVPLLKIMHGYTITLANTIKRAPKHKIGVRLGKVCVAANVPVVEVAEHFGVSRPTIYSWFTGRGTPRQSQEEAIEQYIKKLA